MSFVTDAIGELFGTNDAADEYNQKMQEYAQWAKFSPKSATTGFGTSTFGPKGEVSYQLDPKLMAMRDLFYSGAFQAIPGKPQIDFARGVGQYGIDLFNRAANTDINKVTQDYYGKTLEALTPQRTAEEERLAGTLFKTGRTGYGTGVEGGYVNPETYSLLKAREAQNQQLYLGAEDRARALQLEDIKNAIGYGGMSSELMSTPYKTAAGLFGLGTGVEQLGMAPLDISYKYGTAASNAGANAANFAGQGAQAQYNANLANAGIFSSLLGSGFQGLGGWGGIKDMFGGGSAPAAGGGYGGGGGMITSGFGTGSQNPIGYNFNLGW